MEVEHYYDAIYKRNMEREAEIENKKKNHEEIYSLYKKDQLNLVLLKQNRSKWDTDSYYPGYFEHNFRYISLMGLDYLINSLREDYQKVFKEKELYHRPLTPVKISGIINCWIQGIKVPPPMIVNSIHYNSSTSNPGLIVCDGLHRIKVAFYLGEKKIPVFLRS